MHSVPLPLHYPYRKRIGNDINQGMNLMRRRLVRHDNKTLAFLYVFFGFLNLLFLNDFSDHIIFLFSPPKVGLF